MSVEITMKNGRTLRVSASLVTDPWEGETRYGSRPDTDEMLMDLLRKLPSEEVLRGPEKIR